MKKRNVELEEDISILKKESEKSNEELREERAKLQEFDNKLQRSQNIIS